MTSSRNRDSCPHICSWCMFSCLHISLLFVCLCPYLDFSTSIVSCMCLTFFWHGLYHLACVPIPTVCSSSSVPVWPFVLKHKGKSKWMLIFVNLILLPSYQTGYWRADKARMSSVSPEESPVFNCSSLLTTSRDQDSECVRLGAAGWWGWVFKNKRMERRGTVVESGCTNICLDILEHVGKFWYWDVGRRGLDWWDIGFLSARSPNLFHCIIQCNEMFWRQVYHILLSFTVQSGLTG